MPRKRKPEIRLQRKMHQCMRELMANGWTEQALLVDAAAELAGGDEAAKLTAQRVYDTHIKIMEAN